MAFDYWRYKLHLNIGKLGEVSLKHRSVILFLSVLMLLVDPDLKITFGNASVAGLGISVDPPQAIFLGVFLLALLIYKLIVFWISVFIEHGTDPKRAGRKALLKFDPSYEAEEENHHDMGQIIRNEKGEIIYKWSVRQILWEFIFPNVLAFGGIVTYAIKYFLLK
jgi:hypothetical protein